MKWWGWIGVAMPTWLWLDEVFTQGKDTKLTWGFWSYLLLAWMLWWSAWQ